MRLDHLLSKEIGTRVQILGQTGETESLFNLEGVINNLLGGQKIYPKNGRDINGGVAQLGEHLLCKQGVDSSNLFISTKG